MRLSFDSRPESTTKFTIWSKFYVGDDQLRGEEGGQFRSRTDCARKSRTRSSTCNIEQDIYIYTQAHHIVSTHSGLWWWKCRKVTPCLETPVHEEWLPSPDRISQKGLMFRFSLGTRVSREGSSSYRRSKISFFSLSPSMPPTSYHRRVSRKLMNIEYEASFSLVGKIGRSGCLACACFSSLVSQPEQQH